MRNLAASMVAALLVLCFYVSSTQTMTIPDDEYNALKDLYTYAGGASWKFKTNKGKWDFTNEAEATPCSWEGITCNSTGVDRGQYHVLTVKLSGYGLAGSVSRSIANLTYVKMIDLSYNSLRGGLPPFGEMHYIDVLFFQGNELSGTLDKVFNSSNNHDLQIIDVSQNRLTGTIPGEIFKLPNLEIFAASINCFTPILPFSKICGSKSLLTLSLNGMKTAESCRLNFPGVTLKSVYPLYDAINGLDKCLFNMTSLKTLQLSGNAAMGTLEGVPAVSRKLKSLVLSHNNIQGVIPLVFQHRGFSELDLSFNKFTGVLDSSFKVMTNSSISLNNNRLSGYIPHSLVHLDHIEVLAGNLFACRNDQTDLPQHDHHSGSYNCGSDDFNTSMYLWISLLLVGLTFTALAVLASRHYGVLRESAYGWVRAAGKLFLELYELYLPNLDVSTIIQTYPNYNLEKLEQHVQLVRFVKLNICYLAGFLCVLILIFSLLTLFYSTHTHQYAYSVSMSFIRGQTPAIVLYVLAFVFVGAAGVWYREQISNNVFDIVFSGNHFVQDKDADITMYQVARYRSNIIFMLLILLCNGFVACLINGAFVLMHDSLSNASIQALDVAVAGFKEYWSNYYIRVVVRRLFKNVVYIERNLDQPIVWKKYKLRIASVDNFNLTSTFIQKEAKVMEKFMFGLSLFNNIVAPFVVIGFVSSLCFYNIIEEPPNIDSSYTYRACIRYDNLGQCLAHVPATTTTIFPPPFTYSYKCSAALMYFYAAVYVYLCVFIGFITPLFEWLCFMLTTFWLDKKFAKTHVWLQARLSHLLKPIKQVHEERRASLQDLSAKNQQQHYDDDDALFNKGDYSAEVMNILSLTLTLGLVNPLCGIIMCTTLLIYLLFNEWKIRYFVNAICMHDANNEESCDYLLSKLNLDVTNLNYIFGNLIWISIPLIVSFYAIFVFDIYGDEVGLLKSIWAPITLVTSSLVLYASRDVFKYLGRGSYRVQSSESFRVAVKQTSTLARQTSTLARQASMNIGLSSRSEERTSQMDYYDSGYRFPDFSAKSTQMTVNPMLASRSNSKGSAISQGSSSHSINRESNTSRDSSQGKEHHQHGASIAQQFAPKSNVIDMAHRSRERGEKKPGDQDI